MINDRLFSAKHKLLEQHNGEFDKLFRPSNILAKVFFFLTKNNLVYTILCKLFQMMNMRRIIQLAGSERGGVLKISEFFFLE